MSRLAVEFSKVTVSLNLFSCKKTFLTFPGSRVRPILNLARPKCPLRNGVAVKFYSSEPPDDRENPFQRTIRVLKGDMKYTVDLLDGQLREQEIGRRNMIPNQCDILIIGGGVIGSSTAYWLKERALTGLSVIVLEKDSSVINFKSSDNEVGSIFSLVWK